MCNYKFNVKQFLCIEKYQHTNSKTFLTLYKEMTSGIYYVETL